MGVITKADEVIEKMREDIDANMKSVHEAYTQIIIEECWGADEFNDEFKEKLKKLHAMSLEMRELAKRR